MVFIARDKRRLRLGSIWSGVALTLALIAGSTSPANFPNAEGKAPVNLSEQLAAISGDPVIPTSINLIADRSAQQTVAFKTVSSSLTQISGDLYQGKITKAQARILANIPGLTFSADLAANALPIPDAKPDFVIPKLYWDADVTVNQTDPALAAARVSTDIDGTGVLIAIVDTGVDSAAVGLGGNKVVHREDFSTPPSDSSCTDDGKLDPYGHGTHVASIAAGDDELLQGIAPKASILDLRVLNCAGSGYMSDVDRALQWLLDNLENYPVKVVNMSIGTSDGPQDGLDSTSVLINRLVAKGVFVAVAAGNNGAAAQRLFAPATAEFATTVAAATVNKYGRFLAPYSSHGPTSDGRPGIDLAAPGSGIRAALTSARSGINNVETTLAGTSMASPYVAGIAALLAQKDVSLLPSGVICELSSDCPKGVVSDSMTNGALDAMKTVDWFEQGIDPHSGAGLVVPSATLLNQSLAPAKTQTGVTDPSADNLIRFEPSSSGRTVSLLLGSSWVTDIWAADQSFNVSFVDDNYNWIQNQVVCSIAGGGSSCIFGESTFSPRFYNYYIPPSDKPTFMVIRTNKTLPYIVNVDSFTGAIDTFSGIAIDYIDISASLQGNITLTRTKDSEVRTPFSVSATGGLDVPTSTELPAGPAGTNIQVPIGLTTTPEHSLERVVFKTSDGFMLASSVRVRVDGDGPIHFPSQFGYNDAGWIERVFMANDGSLLSWSNGTGLRNSSGYGNPFHVSADSREAVPLSIPQTFTTQIDTWGFSLDGSTALLREFPAGSGIIPGDEDMYFTYFTRNLQTGEMYQVGPDQSLWGEWFKAPYPQWRVNDDGSAVAWTVTYPTGDLPNKLEVQYGDQMQIRSTLDSFDKGTGLTIFGFTHGKVLVWVAKGTEILQLRLYSLDGTYELITYGDNLNAAVFSEDGSAIATSDGWGTDISCFKDGVRTRFTPPSETGQLGAREFRVANDCSWFIGVFDSSFTFPRGQTGSKLIKITSDGRYFLLDSSPILYDWIMNMAATKFVQVTERPLEPGDLNGVIDIYRGFVNPNPEQLTMRANPTISWTPPAFIEFGESAALDGTTNSLEPIQYEVKSGNCHISMGRVYADSGTGGCEIRASVQATSSHFAGSSIFYIALLKKHRPDSWMTIAMPREVEVGSHTVVAVNTLTPGDFVLSVDGPCSLVNSKLFADATGDCKISSYSDETDSYRGYLTYVWVHVSKMRWTNDQFVLSSPSSAVVGSSFPIQVTNQTGLNAALWVEGGCRLDGMTVTMPQDGRDCFIKYSVSADATHESMERVIRVAAISPTLVTSRITSPGWLALSRLPQGKTLEFNANVQVVSGPCSANGKTVRAVSASGFCQISVGGYTDGANQYETANFTLVLGPAVQAWTKVLPSFSSKKISTTKYTFITTGQPITNYGNAGIWTLSAGCKILKSGAKVSIDMGKAKKCVATLRAPAGFQTSALVKTWTFTR